MTCALCVPSEVCVFCTRRHIRRTGFPGHTLCGKNTYQYPQLRFAPRGSATSDCPDCHVSLDRNNEIHRTKGPAVIAARQRAQVVKNPWRRNEE